MVTCPMCKKTMPDLARRCERCSTDLSLLADFVGQMQTGLAQADSLTRQGRLGEAVWAYLEVLEVDPENPAARMQVGQVATAVRQFDRANPSRRWLKRLRRQARFRRWVEAWRSERTIRVAVIFFAAVVALTASFFLGYYCGATDSTPPPVETSAEES